MQYLAYRNTQGGGEIWPWFKYRNEETDTTPYPAIGRERRPEEMSSNLPIEAQSKESYMDEVSLYHCLDHP